MLCLLRFMIVVAPTVHAGAPAAAPPPDLDAQLRTLSSWLEGEWDNHEQHWRHRHVEQRAQPHEWIHHVFRPVELPAIGANLFFVRQTFGDQPDRVYRQRLYAFTPDPERAAIRLTIHSFKDEARFADGWRNPAVLAELSADDLKTRPGCEVFWHYHGDHFIGSMQRGACRFHSERYGKEIVIYDDLKLTEEALHIRDVAVDANGQPVFGDPDGEHHVNRKVRYYEGWAAIKRGGAAAEPASSDWISMRGIVLHNEGDRVRIVDDSGTPVGYTIELARLTYQKTSTPILKLGVIDEASGKTIAYTWNEPDGRRLGINLGWFQAGVTLRRESVHFRY